MMVQNCLRHYRVSLSDLLPPGWISMLLSGYNGLASADTVNAYVTGVTELMHDLARVIHLCRVAKHLAARDSIENITEHFHACILQALGKPCVS